MKAFVVRETCDLQNWMIGLSEEFHEKCPDLICKGSYGVLAARLLGISYPNYLRYCATHGGTLRGRQGFPTCYFKNKKDAEIICQEINKEWDKFYLEYVKYTS